MPQRALGGHVIPGARRGDRGAVRSPAGPQPDGLGAALAGARAAAPAAGAVVRRSVFRRGQGGADFGAVPAPARPVGAMVAFGDVKGEGVRFTGLATQWAALNCPAEGLDSPEEGRVRLEADHGGATTGVVYPSSVRILCLRCVVWGLGEGLSDFVCAAAKGLHSHQPSTFSADGIGGVRSDGRLRDVCFGLRTVASAEQPNRREATSSLRWVLFDFSSELFLRAFVTICDRLDLTLVPGHDLRAGAHRGQRRVCFYVQRAIWWRSNGIYLSPTTFYNRIGAPRRARSS